MQKNLFSQILMLGGNNIYKMSLRFLSLLVMIWLISAQCPIKQNIDNLESGTLSFVSSDLSSQTIPYTFKTSFTVAPKFALAIQHFDIKSGNHGNFSVSPSLVRSTDVSLRFARNQQVWNRLRINFLATTRSDLVIGSGSESFRAIYNTSAVSLVQFESQVPNYSRSIIRVFLTGYEYKGSLVDIQISGRKLEAKQLSISIDVENDFYLLKVYYSFVVFAPSNIPFASYGGLIAQNAFTGFYYEDAHRIIYNSNYVLYGLNKVTLSGTEPIEFASLIDQNLVAGLYSSRNFDELNLIYIVLGVAPINECVNCSSTEVYAYRSVCMSQCPTGTVTNQYNDKGYACRLCSQKLNQVLINGKCVCNSLSTEKDGVCVLNRGQPYNFLNTISWNNPTSVVQSTTTGGSTQQQQVTTTLITTTTTLPVVTTTTIPISTTAIPASTSTTSTTIQTISNSTCQQSNQYWTGYRCTCKVGYKNESNQCVPLTLQKTKGWIVRQPAIDVNTTQTNDTVVIETPQNVNCYMQFEYFNGDGCVCLPGYNRINGGCVGSTINENITKCQALANREWFNNSCNCKAGFLLVNNDCIKIATSGCPVNSYDNGLGTCICDLGYYKDTKTQLCVKGTPCPPSSTRNTNGTCVCDAGLTMYNGSCAKCPLGAIWDTATSKCLYVCGQNAKYSESSQKCECLTGYGIYNNICDKCPNSMFVKNNYCVQCPSNSVFNQVSAKCECKDGFLIGIQGICVSKCANAETSDTASGKCKCIQGLGRLNSTGICQICPTGTYPSDDSQVCGLCKINQVNVDGQCVCKTGFAPNTVKVCVACESLEGAFLVNGLCAFCPGDQIYDTNTKKCQCPAGKFKSGIKCFDSCKTDQLVDSSNDCYRCQISQVIVNGQCVCKANYLRNNITGICELKCSKSNEFVYKGRCASCPLNLQYRAEINGCACSDGFYLNNNGVCEKVVLLPITCDTGFFFDLNNGCLPCPAGCSSCTAPNACTTCSQKGFRVNKGRCQPLCGDGILTVGESCDDNNTANGDGCSSSCATEVYYICTGSPSVCKYNGPVVCGNGKIQGNETCDDGNTKDGDGCSSKCQKETVVVNNTYGNISLSGDINTNINNVFVVLKTSKKYSFTNENQMESFMKSSFPDSTSIPTVYCSQRQDPDLDLFDCLAIYSSGIPNKKFNIIFSFDYQGDKGKIQVEVDPLKSSIPSRSRTY